MLGVINIRYGLKEGDRLVIIQDKQKRVVTVVKEYPCHILVDMGAYQTSINKVELYIGSVKLVRKERNV